ncbi:Phosphoribosylglycinamide formyltransferase [Lachnellula suecica]|uniref:phosphoribosylglycinamide formyltransferase 1 n=1 Tax=Lachnellula suecica TaxID=602035 RepID=A0A8T9BVK8_9HELO|nr:Phosphoribosylglycinamide formyltransferase [Lachnellula suecica]
MCRAGLEELGPLDTALAARILSTDKERPELIILAGWMHVFSGAFLEPIERARMRIINIHPALPREFDGAMAIERAFEEFKTGRLTRTGIMAHYVIDEVDRGAPIMVKEIEWEGEELEELKERMHFHEHELIVKATAKVAQEIVEGRERKPRDVPKSLSCRRTWCEMLSVRWWLWMYNADFWFLDALSLGKTKAARVNMFCMLDSVDLYST